MEQTSKQILATRKYDIFKLRGDNRNVSKSHVKRLEMMMADYNDLHINPIIVNPRMEVVDGQHRLAAAKNLGETIWYVIDEAYTPKKMIDFNTSRRTWQTTDYLKYWVSHGKQDYIALKAYCNDNNMKIVNALYWIDSANVSYMHAFKNGDFKFEISEEKNRAIKSFLDLKDSMRARNYKPVKIYNQLSFHRACKNIFTNPFISHGRMLKQIENAPYTIKYCSTAREYVIQLVDVYNYRQKNRPRVIHDGDQFEIAM